MSINKETLNDFLPDGFETLNQEGYKREFSSDKIQTGYRKDVPDLVAGDNLNDFIDKVGKNTHKVSNYIDYLNNLQIGQSPIVDSDNKLNATKVGIKYYSATEKFNLNDIVVAIVDNEVKMYKSLMSGNQNNDLTNIAAWEEVKLGGGGGYKAGTLVQSFVQLDDADLHEADGALLTGDGSYGEFVSFMANKAATSPEDFTTEEKWQSDVATYGVCRQFVYDESANTLRLPKINPIVVQGNKSNIPVIGNGMTTGWTSGTQFYGMAVPGGNTIGTQDLAQDNYGKPVGTQGASLSGNSKVTVGLTPDPEKSGIIADTSDLLNTITLYYYIVVGTSVKTDIEVNIDNVMSDLNSKADKDLSNVPASKGILVDSYVNDTSWYRVYSDGWCEQGGELTSVTQNSSDVVTLLQPYANTNYMVNISSLGRRRNSTQYTNGVVVAVRELSQWTIMTDDYTYGRLWEAKGYIR